MSQTEIVLLGMGQVGRAFAHLCESRSLALSRNAGASCTIIAASDSTGVVPVGAGSTTLAEALAWKAAHRHVQSHPARMDWNRASAWLAERANQHPLILVDASADPAVAARILPALRAGASFVTANKEPLADDASYASIVAALREGRGRIRASSTVGAGLPFLDAVHGLAATGEPIISLEATLSGTLAYLLRQLRSGWMLADAVTEAVRLGYAEPDPRQDLSGKDVCRKALILRRAAGFPSAPLTLRPFVDGLQAASTPADLHALLSREHAAVFERMNAAKASGSTLAYVARITPESSDIGLAEVPESSALADPSGRSALQIRTESYGEGSVRILGAGSGALVTGLGMFRDVCSLLRGDPGHFLLPSDLS